MDPDNPRSELFVEEWEMFNSILVDSLNDEEEISAESLIIKEDPLWKHNDSIDDEDEDSSHHQYILPKFIRCYACSPKLKCLKQRTCTIATEIQINEPGKSLEKAILTGTAFLISPFRKDSTNYLLTCANRVSSHEDVETMVKKIVINFTYSRDLFERTDSIDCNVVTCGKYYSKNNFTEDWAILSFDGSDCVISEECFGENVIPSPSVLTNLSVSEDLYNILIVGLCSPSQKLIEMKSKETGIEASVIGRMIPKEGIEFSLGWITEIKDNKKAHNASTTESFCGSPIFIGNHSVQEFMNLYRTSDILQRKNSAFKDYIHSHKFSNRIVGILSGHDQSKNMACSVLSWFDAFYEHVYLPLKDCYSTEEQNLIELEKLIKI